MTADHLPPSEQAAIERAAEIVAFSGDFKLDMNRIISGLVDAHMVEVQVKIVKLILGKNQIIAGLQREISELDTELRDLRRTFGVTDKHKVKS